MKIHPFIMSIVIQLICLNSISCQCWDPGPFPPALDSFYTRINQAELFITDNNLNAAIKSYVKASAFRPLDYYDRVNLLECYLQSERMPEAVSVIIQMAEDQFPLVFLNAKKYEDLINDETWIYYVQNNYNAPAPFPVRKIIRETYDEFQKYVNFKKPDSAALVYHSIATKMKKMILEYDYPSEQALGYGGSMYQPSMYQPIFMFFVVVSDSTFNSDSVFQDQLLRGKMSPDLIATYNKIKGMTDCGCAPFTDAIYFEYNNKLYSCTKEREIFVNKCRELLHMPLLADVKKLIAYQNNNPQFKFRIGYNAGSTYIKTENSGEPFDINNYSDQIELVKELGQNDFHYSK